MIDTPLKSEQNQFLRLDTDKIFSTPLYIFIEVKCLRTLNHMIDLNDIKNDGLQKIFCDRMEVLDMWAQWLPLEDFNMFNVHLALFRKDITHNH